MSAAKYQIPEARDWRGNLMSVGDTVLYPRQSGRSVELREAVVLEVWRMDEDRNVYSYGPGRGMTVTKAADYRFKLQPTGRSSRGFADGQKAVWLNVGENVTAAR